MEHTDLLNYKNAQSEETLDRYTSLILEAHFDQQQKEDWAEKLRKEHGVFKPKTSKKSKIAHLRKYLLWTTGVAAVMTLFWLNLHLTSQLTTTTDQFVSAELSDQLPYFGRRKGLESDNKIRQTAYDNYQEKNFATAITSFGVLDEQGKLENDDILFFALSYLYQENYSKAIAHLEQMSKQEQFTSHTNWYLALAYYRNGQKNLAISALTKHLALDKNGIKQEEANRFLQKLQRNE